jgi:anti-sigma regulatory factor (Ser/Thr protein kinase)
MEGVPNRDPLHTLGRGSRVIRFSWPKPGLNGALSNDGLVISLPGGAGASYRARRAIEMLASDLARPISRAQLLVTELVTNSVRHGNVGPGGQILVDVALRDGVVRLTVTDSGPGFAPVRPALDPTSDGGIGLLLVDRLAERWGVSQGGRSVWFEVRRQLRPGLDSTEGRRVA